MKKFIYHLTTHHATCKFWVVLQLGICMDLFDNINQQEGTCSQFWSSYNNSIKNFIHLLSFYVCRKYFIQNMNFSLINSYSIAKVSLHAWVLIWIYSLFGAENFTVAKHNFKYHNFSIQPALSIDMARTVHDYNYY
jgi:hypothetical protein